MSSYEVTMKVCASNRAAIQVFAIAILAFVTVAPSAHASREPSVETLVMPLSGMGESGEAPVYWDFRIDAGRRAGEWTRIRVPSNWEQEGFGAYFYGTQGQRLPDDHPTIARETGEYRTEFLAPAGWRGRHVRIVFEGSMTDTEVMVNGRSAGEVHQGGFYRFHYDLTDLLEYGSKNLLQVRVSKESANASVNLAERRGDYWTFGGIYRPVWLEARPSHHIDWIAIDARADGSFYAQAHLNESPPVGSAIVAQIYDVNGKAIDAPVITPIGADRRMAVVRTTVPSPRLWSAEHPQLYEVRFTLRSAHGDLHTVRERFGFRTFEVRPRDGLYLNGRKIVLKGINRHSFRPKTARTLTRADSYADARLIKEANMNAVRMSHYPPDKHFLDAADELGLYVLHELAGWQGAYDTPTAARLIGQLVRRDVNHPSVLFWDNGNEGGWNREVDGEFDRWDPQRRPVLHPWAIHSGINTDHYENYESTVKLSAGPDIFMPTEFLHGLYDGGIGAGLEDYWRVMRGSPTVAGGFFWAFADESIARTDRNDQLDSVGNAAPDGIVGPHGEKEGSFFTVKEVWSPVQIENLRMDTKQGLLTMTVRNDYAFTDLSRHRFQWKVIRMPQAGARKGDRVIKRSGSVAGPKLEPGQSAPWRIALPTSKLASDEVVHLTISDPTGHELWTWAAIASKPTQSAIMTGAPNGLELAQQTGESVVVAGKYTLTFDNASGRLREIRTGDAVHAIANGPRALAYRRDKRQFLPIEQSARFLELRVSSSRATDGIVASATYEGALRRVTWSLSADVLVLSYELAYEGSLDVFGVQFDLPETAVKSKRWLGHGPYRVWQNRLRGGLFDFHETAFNDPTPGETHAYPEFKGYFGEWRWLALETASGDIVIENLDGVPYFGLHQPRGGVNPVLELPDVGLSFLHVIPAMGTKFDEPSTLGPQSQPRHLSGVQRGSVRLRFE